MGRRTPKSPRPTAKKAQGGVGRLAKSPPQSVPVLRHYPGGKATKTFITFAACDVTNVDGDASELSLTREAGGWYITAKLAEGEYSDWQVIHPPERIATRINFRHITSYETALAAVKALQAVHAILA
jgi:hypothetical protein